MTLSPTLRDFYTRSSLMTALDAHALDNLPKDIGGLCKTIQGLLIHEHLALAYRQRLTDDRRAESHLRSLQQTLTKALEKNNAPLTETRPLYQKTVGVCRHFTVMMVAMLRAHGIPARSRCGFGAYFSPGKFVDHWVAEYWDGTRWKLVDAQIDPSQRAMFHIAFDLHDVPRDQFLIAGDAWQQCRSGKTDPAAFGMFEMKGYWFIAGNIIRDAAALNNVEMLPWDCWGAMPQPDETMTDEKLAFFDSLSELTLDPDTHFEDLRAAFKDERLAIPPVVFNAVLNRPDKVAV